MKYLFIAEKPSLMRDVQACYFRHKAEVQAKVGDIDFIALSGHVCTNFEPDDYDQWANVKWQNVDYPMIPTAWGIKPIPDKRKNETIRQIKTAVPSYDGIIVGTDSDVEGYGIYYLLEHYLGLEKKPALRFMEHSLADLEILQSLLSMTDYHKDPRHVRFTESFLLRSRSDWLYGMNATRMMTVKTTKLTTIGRVKAPTIKLVYDNSKSIDEFVPEDYYQAEAQYDGFTAMLVDDSMKEVRFKDKSDIPDFPLEGKIIEAKKERKKTHAPKLFDLSAIQSEAGSKYGLKPSETLDIIQSLYEKHKVISYPRTQCRFVSTEKAKEFQDMVRNMDVFPELAPFISEIRPSAYTDILSDKSVVNDKEIEKESHDALLPTSVRPDPSKLTDQERKICLMIYTRLLAQLLPAYEEDKTQLKIQHGDGIFKADGNMPAVQGWRQLYKARAGKTIPELNKGDTVTAREISPKKGTTRPPKRLTQSSLIDAMENISKTIDDAKLRKSLEESKGIGTPATRASIITDIIGRGYVEDRKDGLYITEAGKAYIGSVQSLDIVSPVFAASIDTDIKKIQRGEEEYGAVYARIIDGLDKMCRQINGIKVSLPETGAVCPICGSPLYDTKYQYICQNDGLAVSKFICGHYVTPEELKRMAEGESVGPFDFKKKDGKTFSAKLKIDKTAKKIAFDFAPDYIMCPKCGKKMLKLNKWGAFCDSCDFKFFRTEYGREFTDGEIRHLMKEKRLENLQGFVSKRTGKTYSATLYLDDDFKAKLSFE